MVVTPVDSTDEDVVALVRTHLAFARSVTAPGLVYALDPSAGLDGDLTFFGARRRGRLVGIGALHHLDAGHVEIKAMHVPAPSRGAGIGRAVVEELLRQAALRGYGRVSLETGTGEAFAPARALYRAVGFTPCPPFGPYRPDPASTCLTLVLPPAGPPGD